MSYFKELKLRNTLVIAVPATTTEEERMKLLRFINIEVNKAIVDLRRENVNFLPLEVTTTLESME